MIMPNTNSNAKPSTATSSPAYKPGMYCGSRPSTISWWKTSLFVIATLLVTVSLGGCLGCSSCSGDKETDDKADAGGASSASATPTPPPLPPDPEAPKPPSTASATTPPPPVPTGPYLTEQEASQLPACKSTLVGKDAGRWYMVYRNSQDSKQTLAALLCVGPTGQFTLAEHVKVVATNVYIREGGHETVGVLDGARRLSDMSDDGKVYANVRGLRDGTGSTHLFSNPVMVYVMEGPAFDFCKQYEMKERPEPDEFVEREIWDRCNMGGDENKVIVQRIYSGCADGTCATREDLARVAAGLEAHKQSPHAKPRPNVVRGADPSSPGY